MSTSQGSCSILPEDASEWPYKGYLIHRYPSITEYCDYDGSILRTGPSKGGCLRAIYLTYVLSRLEQAGFADKRSDAPTDDEEYENAFIGPNTSGCMNALDIENASIRLQKIRAYYMVCENFVSAGKNGSYGDDSDAYEEAAGNAANEVHLALLAQTKERLLWNRPHFDRSSCFVASEISRMLDRANSIRCFVKRWNIFGAYSSLAVIVTLTQSSLGREHSVCSAMNWTSTSSGAGLTAGSAHVYEEGTTKLPNNALETALREFFSNKHGYAISLSKFAPEGVHESCEVSLTMVLGIQRGKFKVSLGKKSEGSAGWSCGTIDDTCGTHSSGYITYDRVYHSDYDYQIITITTSGRTEEIDGVLYAIDAATLAAEIYSAASISTLSLGELSEEVYDYDYVHDDGCCVQEEDWDCCPDDWYCPEGCKEISECGVDQGETQPDDHCVRCNIDGSIRNKKATRSYDDKMKMGFGDLSADIRVKELYSFIQVKPCFLSLS